MKKLIGTLATVTLVALFAVWPAQIAAAETVSLNPSADTDAASAARSENFGSAPHLNLFNNALARTWPFLQFDLSSIPANSSITNATFSIYVWGCLAPEESSVVVLRCTEPWGETSLTWDNKPSVSPAAAAEGVFVRETDIYQSVDVTGLVQGWISGEYPNNGFRLAFSAYLKPTVEREWYLRSRETPEVPILVVNYTPAAPTSDSTSTAGPAASSTAPTTSQQATGSQITKVKVERIKENSAYVTWTTDVDANSYVDYGETKEYGKTTGKDDGTKTHAVQLIELKADKTYRFRVRSKGANGQEVVSTDHAFRTAKESSSAGKAAETSKRGSLWLWIGVGGLGLLALILAVALTVLAVRHRRLTALKG